MNKITFKYLLLTNIQIIKINSTKMAGNKINKFNIGALTQSTTG